MDKRQQEIDRGALARVVLENPVYLEAWQLCEDKLLMKFRQAPTDDPDGLLRIRLAFLAMDVMRKALEETMQTGKLAERQVDEIAQTSMDRLRLRTVAKENWR